MNLLHHLFGQHSPQVAANHWEDGNFVSRCVVCNCVITRLPGLPWRKAAVQPRAEKAQDL